MRMREHTQVKFTYVQHVLAEERFVNSNICMNTRCTEFHWWILKTAWQGLTLRHEIWHTWTYLEGTQRQITSPKIEIAPIRQVCNGGKSLIKTMNALEV